MKKIIFLLIFILSTQLLAAGFGGSKDVHIQVSKGKAIEPVAKTIQEIDENNFPVELFGYIIHQENEKVYLFKDKTGTIKVEIPENVWPSETIYQEDVVRIEGFTFRLGNEYAVRVNKLQKK